MTKEEAYAFGRVFGILDSVLELKTTEKSLASSDPIGQLPQALNRRMRKISEEVNERIAQEMAAISPSVNGRLTLEQQGSFWLGWHSSARPAGRPAMYGEAMVNKTIKMPADLWEKATEKAGQQGESVSEVIRRLLTGYVS